MKRFLLLVSLLAGAFVNVYSQCKDCHDGGHFGSTHSLASNRHFDGKKLPPDSSGGLAQSFVMQNVCGLNWEQTSVEVTTRYPPTQGVGLPATVPLTFSACSVDSVVKAFLYFNGSYFTSYAANPASVSITNPAAIVSNYSADSIGIGPPKCWSEVGTIAYRVDVTSCINGGGNYSVNITGTGMTDQAIDGITFVIIYIDKSAAYSGSISLWDGLYTNSSGQSKTQTFTGFNVCNATPTGQAFSILADMQNNISTTNTETYNGSTSTFPNLFYNFCTVTTSLTAGQTSSTYSVYTNDFDDCYSWVLSGLYWQNTNCQTCVPTVLATNTVTIVPPRDTICQGDSVQLTASGDSSYIWAPATGLSCTSCANPMASPNATTTYSVTGFIGCTIGEDTVQVVVSPKGTLTVTPTTTLVCPNTPVQLNASGGVNYVWTPANSLSCNTCSNPISTASVSTTYTVVSGTSGCKDSATVTINRGAPVPTVIPSTSTICYGASETLTASGDSTYFWSPSSSVSCNYCSAPLASPTVTTTYTIVGIAPGGCTDSTYATITVIPTPTVSVTPFDTSICRGSSILMNATGAANFHWNPSTGLTCNTCPNPTANPTVTTTYTLIGATSGCKDTIMDTIFVLTTPVGSINAIPDSVCQGDSVLLIGGGGGKYLWSNNKTTDSIYVEPSSSVTYTLIVSNIACADTTQKSLFITPRITAAASIIDSVICPFDTSYLAVVSSGGPASYKWSTSSTSSAIMVTPGTTTTYTVTAYGKCDSITFTKTVTVIPLPKPVITATSTVCYGSKDTLSVSSVTNPTKYLWSNGKTTTTITTGDIKGDSTIYVTATNSLGCAVKDSFKVDDKLYPSGTLIYPLPCLNYPTTITARATGPGPFTYKWSTGGTYDTINIILTDTTTYTVTISNGCPIVKSITVVPDSPTLFACCNTNIIIGNDTTITASGASKYSWLPTTGLNCDTCSTVVATPTVTTTYTVTGTDAAGCTVERVVTITVETPCFNFDVPNVFTPNDGGPYGFNKMFYIKTENLSGWAITIYDRWGKEVFKTSNPLDYWTGTTESGGNAPDGVYYYIINATCQENTYKKDGFLQLIR
jgi:gliding motility-associated-like protein